MNNELQEFARNQLIVKLTLLPESNQLIFKRMYSPNNLDKDILDVIRDIPEEKLDWAMQQVLRTINEGKQK